MKKALIYISALLTGLFAGFFLVLNFMFSDVSSFAERGISFLIVLVVYLALGAVFGLFEGNLGRRSGIFLCLPALIFTVFYLIREPDILITGLVYSVLAAAASVTGSRLGNKLRKKSKQ